MLSFGYDYFTKYIVYLKYFMLHFVVILKCVLRFLGLPDSEVVINNSLSLMDEEMGIVEKCDLSVNAKERGATTVVKLMCHHSQGYAIDDSYRKVTEKYAQFYGKYVLGIAEPEIDTLHKMYECNESRGYVVKNSLVVLKTISRFMSKPEDENVYLPLVTYQLFDANLRRCQITAHESWLSIVVPADLDGY